MKFPLIKKSTDSTFPFDNKCPVCGKKIGEPNTFFSIMGGALKEIEKHVFFPADDLSGFLYLDFHGAHDSGKGEYPDCHAFTEVVKHANEGQFCISFCSIPCAREFFNSILDEMEIKVKKMDKKINHKK